MRENTKDARWRSAQFPGKGVRSELCSARALPRVYRGRPLFTRIAITSPRGNCTCHNEIKDKTGRFAIGKPRPCGKGSGDRSR